MRELLDAALTYAARDISAILLHTPTSTGCSCSKGPVCPRRITVPAPPRSGPRDG